MLIIFLKRGIGLAKRDKKISRDGEFIPTTRVTEYSADIVYMMAAHGLDAKGISDASGFPIDFVKKALKREGARALIHDFQSRFYGDDLTKMLKPMAMKALKTIDSLISDPRTKDNIKLSASQDILDRTMGKPKQFIEHSDGDIKGLYERIDKLMSEKTTVKIVEVESREKIVDTVEEEKTQEPNAADEIDKYFQEKDRKDS